MGRTLIVESVSGDEIEEKSQQFEGFSVTESPLEIASAAKIAGINAAKAGNIEMAASLFEHGASVLHSACWNKDGENNNKMCHASPEQEMNVACLLNLSMMHLQAEHWEKAVAVCTDVLKMCPFNKKALFRRCKAQIRIGCFESAGHDLLPLLEAERENSKLLELKKELAVLGINFDTLQGNGIKGDEKEEVSHIEEIRSDRFDSVDVVYYELSWNPSSGEELGVTINSDSEARPVVEFVSEDRCGEVSVGDVVVNINGGYSSMDRLVEEVSIAMDGGQSVTLRLMHRSDDLRTESSKPQEKGDPGRLDKILLKIAEETSSMLGEMTFQEKQEFAAVLATDVAGLERLTADVAAANSQPSPVIPCATVAEKEGSDGVVRAQFESLEFTGLSLKVQAEDDESREAVDDTVVGTRYEMVPDWLEYNKLPLANDCDNMLGACLPQLDANVDMRSLVASMRHGKPKPREQKRSQVTDIVLMEEEEEMIKAKFMFLQQQTKESKRRKQANSLRHRKQKTMNKGRNEIVDQKVNGAWLDLCDLESQSIQGFKKRITLTTNQNHQDGISKERVAVCRRKKKIDNKNTIENEWGALVEEEQANINLVKTKLTSHI